MNKRNAQVFIVVSLESPFCFFLFFFFCLSLSKLSFLCLLYRSVLSSIFWGWISSLASNKICLLFGYHEDAQNFPGMQGCVSLCGEDGPVQMERLCPGWQVSGPSVSLCLPQDHRCSRADAYSSYCIGAFVSLQKREAFDSLKPYSPTWAADTL